MKVTLIGKLGKVIERQGFVITTMQYTGPLPNLPKGVPQPDPLPPTTYVIYIGQRQWRRIKAAVEDPEDTVVIEGTQFYDAQYEAITIFATSCTTRILEQQRREEQKAQATEAESTEAAEETT
ncbi:MAG: hypothetical protein HC837_02600 [Chloroflexaceae bacterium]|nr:hypothetical protein [Chloroflexaceae bacterium]